MNSAIDHSPTTTNNPTVNAQQADPIVMPQELKWYSEDKVDSTAIKQEYFGNDTC